MPKTGMKPIRKKELVDAAVLEIGRVGTLDVTVSQIAKRAGVSSALAHHYLGSKDEMFLAAMRHILTVYGAEVRGALTMADTPRDRLDAIVRASFSDRNFRPEVVSAWLNFYVQANKSEATAKLLNIYRKRLHSNLVHELKQLVGAEADRVARGMSAIIDGLYIQLALSKGEVQKHDLVQMVQDYLDLSLQRYGVEKRA